jgi:hypothetical protein
MAAKQLDFDFWVRLNTMAANLPARPEDIIVVLASETSGTMDPKVTNWARFPGPAPKTWDEVNQRCHDYYVAHHGPGIPSWATPYCGGLGLNTITAETAAAMGMSPAEWWSLPDLTPAQGLDYAERFFKYLLNVYGAGKLGYANALDLYLANAAKQAWRTRPLLLSNVVYGPNTGYSANSALDNIRTRAGVSYDAVGNPLSKKGYVDVEDMKNAVLNSYKNWAAPYLKQYWDFMSNVAQQAPSTTPYVPVSYGMPGSLAGPNYVPQETKNDGQDALRAINGDGLQNPVQPVLPPVQAPMRAPNVNWLKDLVVVGLIGAAGWAVYRYGFKKMAA